MTANLFDRIASSVADSGKTALETATGERHSYADLLSLSGRLANALASRGVKPGDRVAAQVEKSPTALVLYLGDLARRGGRSCRSTRPIRRPSSTTSSATPSRRLSSAIRRNAKGSPPSPKDRAPRSRPSTPRARHRSWTPRPGSRRASTRCARVDDDLAAILYTSGTTGRSKGAMLTHENLASNALTLKDAWRFSADDVLIHALPIYHTHGLFVASNVALLSGASMIFLPKFDADEILRLMPRATVMMGVPTFYMRLLQHPGLTREATRHMRLFVSGLGAASGRNAPRMAGPHRPRHPRALRHDRDQHEHLEPL